MTTRRPGQRHQAGPVSLFSKECALEGRLRGSLHGLLMCAVVFALAACGGGGSDSSAATPARAVPVSTAYPNSIVLGATGFQHLEYTPAAGALAATVTAAASSTVLPLGRTALVAEHRDARYPGLILACVSGKGDSTNVMTESTWALSRRASLSCSTLVGVQLKPKLLGRPQQAQGGPGWVGKTVGPNRKDLLHRLPGSSLRRTRDTLRTSTTAIRRPASTRFDA